VRSVFDLFLVSLSGGDAALSTILAGDLDEILKAVFAPPPVLPEPEDIPAPQGVEATVILGGPVVPPSRLVVEAGILAGKVFFLKDGLTIGRLDDCGIVVVDPGVSRHHAKFFRDSKGAWSVQDLGSSNGTFVNESRVGGAVVLAPGDRIRAGETVLLFDPPAA
jgi:pSer/pThr/pTyr-binding forkhead associated (FHA) protein